MLWVNNMERCSSVYYIEYYIHSNVWLLQGGMVKYDELAVVVMQTVVVSRSFSFSFHLVVLYVDVWEPLAKQLLDEWVRSGHIMSDVISIRDRSDAIIEKISAFVLFVIGFHPFILTDSLSVAYVCGITGIIRGNR